MWCYRDTLLNTAYCTLPELEKANPMGSNFLADPGKARGYSINSLVINSLTDSVTLFLKQLYGAATRVVHLSDLNFF